MSCSSTCALFPCKPFVPTLDFPRYLFALRCAQDPSTFKGIVIPVMGMQDAEESWKTRVHSHFTKVGYFIASPRSGKKDQARLQESFAVLVSLRPVTIWPRRPFVREKSTVRKINRSEPSTSWDLRTCRNSSTTHRFRHSVCSGLLYTRDMQTAQSQPQLFFPASSSSKLS